MKTLPLFLVHTVGAIIAFPIGILALAVFHIKRFFQYV